MAQINLNVDLKVLVPVILAFIGWGVSLEIRMASSIPQRVSNLETTMMPVLIEYGVRQELAKMGKSAPITPVVEERGELRASKPEYDRLLLEQKTIAEDKIMNRKSEK